MHKINARLSQRIAEEAQLLCEERWIIEALTKLKQQRNSLQIERLHLENLKATINKEDLRYLISSKDVLASKHGKTSPLLSVSNRNDPVPTTVIEPGPEVPGTSLAQLEGPVAGIDDEMCNTEELNLAVTNSVFTGQDTGAYDIEEEEEDMENCEIDMNMFMYGK